jgi:poly-beta-1,6-N-acetyl-D-glucosamine N-deacetylase
VQRRLAIVLLLCAFLTAGCSGARDRRPSAIAEAAPAITPTVARPAPTAPAAQEPPKTSPAPATKPASETAPAKPGATKPQAPTKSPAPAPATEPNKVQPRLAILVYHDVDEQFQSDYTITPALLEAQITMLQAEGYHFYTFDEVEQLLAGGEGLPTMGVMLAFDDGYQSFVTQVGPLAEKYGVPAVCFVVTKYMSMDIFMGRPHMAPVEMKQAVASPLLDLGGHSWDGHRTGLTADGSQAPVLTKPIWHHKAPAVETQAEYEQRVLLDFQTSGKILEEYGVSTGLRHFTFPYTARSEDAVRLGQEAGVTYFYVGGERLVTPDTDPTAIPRVHAGAPYMTADVLRETLRTLFGQP